MPSARGCFAPRQNVSVRLKDLSIFGNQPTLLRHLCGSVKGGSFAFNSVGICVPCDQTIAPVVRQQHQQPRKNDWPCDATRAQYAWHAMSRQNDTVTNTAETKNKFKFTVRGGQGISTPHPWVSSGG